MGVFLDKATAFRIKIASKNQLRALLKQKKKVFDEIKNEPGMEFTSGELAKEIQAIEFELASYD